MQNLFDLSGKTALVTGASGGLGEQCARCLSKAGARVILTARRRSLLESVASALSNAIALEMDVSDRTSVQRAWEALEQSREKVDICVNNAGIAGRTPVFNEDATHRFEQIMQTNILGLWYVTQAAALHMKNHQIEGSIINISSINGANKLGPEFAGYAASKAAVIQLTKALVGELSPHHIRINCILPGVFETPLTAYRLKTDEMREELSHKIPLGFVAQPPDLDGAILLLASNAASHYMTGSLITVDGGISWGG